MSSNILCTLWLIKLWYLNLFVFQNWLLENHKNVVCIQTEFNDDYRARDDCFPYSATFTTFKDDSQYVSSYKVLGGVMDLSTEKTILQYLTKEFRSEIWTNKPKFSEVEFRLKTANFKRGKVNTDKQIWQAEGTYTNLECKFTYWFLILHWHPTPQGVRRGQNVELKDLFQSSKS